MKHAKFSNNLIKLSLFMIIVTSLFATISCENNGVGSSSSTESNSKLPDISDVGRSISVDSDGDLIIKWYAPDIDDNAKTPDNTKLTAANLSYKVYYIAKVINSERTPAQIQTAAATETPQQIETTNKNVTQAEIDHSKLNAGTTYEIAITVVNGDEESDGVRFEVAYKSTQKPKFETKPSDVSFFTVTPITSTEVTININDAAVADSNEYWIYYKAGTGLDTADVKKETAKKMSDTTSDPKTSYKLTDLTKNTAYTIVVQQVITTTTQGQTTTKHYTSIEAKKEITTDNS